MSQRNPYGVALAACALMLLAGCSVPAADIGGDTEPSPAEAQPIALTPGDRLNVTVVDEADLSGTYELDQDGVFEMPLIGPIDAYRQSPATVEAMITAALADGFLRAPEVRVELASLRPFFISGAVRRPGSYAFRSGMDVAAAIAEAGGALVPGQAFDIVVTPAGRARVERVVELGALLAPGDIVEIRERTG